MIELIRHRYIIDNVFLLLSSAVQARQDAVKFHPLGECE